MKINIDSLVIEVGRKCNMSPPCRHCLRGHPQNKVIFEDVLEKFFSQVNYISEITIGGGEPTLHLSEIDTLISMILKYDVIVGNFYIVTNGKVFRKRLLEICEFLYNDVCEDNEISGLSVSDDKFHRERHKDINKFLQNKHKYYFEYEYENDWSFARPYAQKDKETDFSKVSIINMGMAKTNGIGNRELDIYLPYKEIWDDEIVVRDTELYLTHDGRLLPCCDLSYDIIDSNKYTIGNIMTEDLLSIVQKLPNEDDEHEFTKFWKGAK
jgi:MoaA/NifB/PqqE/SkfB family radical SAM enzyme